MTGVSGGPASRAEWVAAKADLESITFDRMVLACELAYGVSPRQCNHWVDRGWIVVRGMGSGHPRYISKFERAVMSRMCGLVKFGMRPEPAADLARKMALHPNEPVGERVSPHVDVWIEWSDDREIKIFDQ